MAQIDGLRIVTDEFRASHPHVFKPSTIKGGDKATYSIEMLFDKKTTKVSELQAPLITAAKEKWGPDKKKWPSPLMLPIKDGDKPRMNKKSRQMEVIPEHKGMWVVRASSSAEFSKPHVVGKDPKVALTDESQFYPGCYARAYLKAHAYEFADKFGVKFILDGVQFIRDGKALGGKKPADQMFGVIEGDEGDDIGANEAAEFNDGDAAEMDAEAENETFM